MNLLKLIPLLFLAGCETAGTTRFMYCDGAQSVQVDFPKEMDATDFKIVIDAKNGTAQISASKIQTRNVESIKAQGAREAANLGKVSNLAGDVTKGAVSGAIKGVIP